MILFLLIANLVLAVVNCAIFMHTRNLGCFYSFIVCLVCALLLQQFHQKDRT